MATKKLKDQQIAVRLAPDSRRLFINKAAQYGGTSVVLRELVQAFVEDRVTVKPPSIEGTIYNV